MNDIVLSATLPIVGRGPATHRGLLGPIFVDPDTSRVYALTAAQIVTFGDMQITLAGERFGRELAARVPKLTLKKSKDQDATALIAVVELKRYRIDTRLYDYCATTPIVAGRTWSSNKSILRVVSANRSVREVELISLSSAFSMPNPLGGGLCTFDNALELRPTSSGPLIAVGDAGSIVLDEDGNWLAIVVAGAADLAFAAPLKPVVQALGLSVPTSEDIDGENRRLNRFVEDRRLERFSRSRVSGGVITPALVEQVGQPADKILDDIRLAHEVLA